MTRGSPFLLLLVLACQGGPAVARDPDLQLSEILRRFSEDGDAAGALAGLDEVIRARPDWVEAHRARANVLVAAGRPAIALPAWDRVIILEPKNLDALTARGLLLADLGRAAEAERDFAAVIEAAPKAPDGYLLRAWLERRDGRHSESQRDLAEARARDPERWEAYHNAGAAAARAGWWPQAARNFELAVLLRPDHADGWIALSRAHASLGHADRALEELDRADRERPKDPAVWYWRGELLRSLERHVEAVRAYDRAIAFGAAPIMYSGRAQSRVRLDDAPGAEKDFATALELEPGLREAWVARARWRAASGRTDAAREDYAAALRIRASAPVLRELARLHQERGQWASAVAGYERALSICVEPDLRPVLERDLADARAHLK